MGAAMDMTGVRLTELVEAAGIPARRVLSTLTLLQIRQLVAEEGRRFSTQVELKEEP